MAEKSSIVPIVVVIAVVLLAGGAAGAYLYEKNLPKASPAPNTVRVGDNVTVRYIGILGSGPEQGRVFDTSIQSVAYDNATYPKALQYHLRGSASQYTPLPVFVGASAPGGHYSFAGMNFTQVIPGFWQGLVGVAGNQTKDIVVPPALGYAHADSCVRSLPLTVHAPVYESIPGPVFAARYPGVVATTGASFLNGTFGWRTIILSANATSVAIENLAVVGGTATSQGWTTEVTNVTSTANGTGEITVVNQLTPSQAGHLQAHAANGLCSGSSQGEFIVTAVNYTAGTFTEDFNQEVAGQTLIFEVTVVDIFHPVAPLA